MCQCGSKECDKCTTIDSGGVGRVGRNRNFLYLSFNFSVNLKLLYKNKVYYLKILLAICVHIINFSVSEDRSRTIPVNIYWALYIDFLFKPGEIDIIFVV